MSKSIAEDMDGNELLHAFGLNIKEFYDYLTSITSDNLEVSNMIKNILDSLNGVENKYPDKKLSIAFEFYALKLKK